MSNRVRILVILPAHNEALNIARTVREIRARLPQVDVLVMDDGSLDATSAEARAAGAAVLELPFNVGIGAAVQAGFQFAAANGYEVVLRNDGDGQHAPECNADLLACLEESEVDVVIGSRFIGARGDYGTPMMRRLGSGIFGALAFRHHPPTGHRPDFRLLSLQSAPRFNCWLKSYPHDYPEPEAVVILHRSGLRQMEVPVTMVPRAVWPVVYHAGAFGLLHDQGDLGDPGQPAAATATI